MDDDFIMNDNEAHNDSVGGFDISKLRVDPNNELRASLGGATKRLKEMSDAISIATKGASSVSNLQEAVKSAGFGDLKDLVAMTDASSPVANMRETIGKLGLDDSSSISRAFAGIVEQQNVLDEMQRDRLELAPPIHEVHLPENPIEETNRKLERIERRFDQVSQIAETSAQTATELQFAAAEFLNEFKEAASKNDEAAADAIRLGRKAVWAAVLIPILVFAAQIAANLLIPNDQTESLQQTILNLQAEISEMRSDSAAENQNLVDALTASNEAMATSIIEGLKPAETTTIEIE